MRRTISVVLLGLALTGCQGEDDTTSLRGGLPVPEGIERNTNPALLAQGEQIYRQHCADCHATDAGGAPNWRKRDAEGLFPPPPLNGSGHAWHHSTEVLANLIRNGSPGGKGRMPAWTGKLSEQEITAVIAWFQSLWPQQVYDAWYEMQQRGR